MRYSQQRRAGSGVSDNTSASSSLQEMYAEGIDPSLCSGPPSAPPFQNQQMSASRLGREASQGSHPAVTQSSLAGNFIGANQAILNYNPTAQNFLPQRQVTKRAKAPIAIVDPSQKSDAADPSLPGESFATDSPELTAA